MTVILAQPLFHGLLNCVTMLCFTLGHTLHRYYTMPYLPRLNIILYLKTSSFI